jgi:hypothetical protein
MKLLLLAANPDTSSTLSLDREITELQRRFLDTSPEPFEFIPLPDLRVDDLPRELRRIEPDVLHVTAHGEKSHLVLADIGGNAVEITPERLAAFLSPNRPPRLVYFNGCKSAEMAKGVLGPVAMAVGTAVTIANGTARSAAVSFYERVLAGDSVRIAFAAASAMAAAKGGVDLELHARPGVDPACEVLRPRPRLVVRFARVQRGTDGTFPICVGIAQCPRETTQLVVFFEGETSPCISTRPDWADGMAWLGAELSVAADHRLFVVGLIGGAPRFIAEARLSQALIGSEREEVKWAVCLLKQRSAQPRTYA